MLFRTAALTFGLFASRVLSDGTPSLTVVMTQDGDEQNCVFQSAGLCNSASGANPSSEVFGAYRKGNITCDFDHNLRHLCPGAEEGKEPLWMRIEKADDPPRVSIVVSRPNDATSKRCEFDEGLMPGSECTLRDGEKDYAVATLAQSMPAASATLVRRSVPTAAVKG